MKKGVAVPYIIAILLGVAVIGLIGYWLFVSGGKIRQSATLQECRTDALTWCQEALANKWFVDSSTFTDNAFGVNVNQFPECSKFKTDVGLDSFVNAKKTCGVS